MIMINFLSYLKKAEDYSDDICKLFLKFLHEHNAYNNFKINLMYQDFKDRRNLKVCSHFIMHAFYWADSLEGYGFWCYLDSEWIYCLKEYREKNTK